MFALQILLQHLSPIDQEGGTVMKIMILINFVENNGFILSGSLPKGPLNMPNL